MIQELCHILAKRIAAAGLVTVSGGLATVWKYNDKDKHTKAAYWDYDTQQHVVLAPDADRAAITYFEERSTQITGNIEGNYRSSLDLIGWVNTGKGVSTPLLIQAIQELFKLPFNEGMYTGVKVTFNELLPESEQLFSRYNYDTAVRKYLQKPYDAFGLRCVVTFNVNVQC